jgi:hypothetical protein
MNLKITSIRGKKKKKKTVMFYVFLAKKKKKVLCEGFMIKFCATNIMSSHFDSVSLSKSL